MAERRYQFKEELLKVHKEGIRNYDLTPEADEFVIGEGIKIVIPEDAGIVIKTAANDFADYMFTTMKMSGVVTRKCADGDKAIKISLANDLGEAQGYMGYRLTISDDGITLEGADEKGVAQGLYYLEDRMNIRKAPFIKKGVVAKRALFNSRSTHSPLGMFEFTDEALSLMAHLGFDTISVWLKGDPETTQRGDFIDIQLLYNRAAKYGIGLVVAYSCPHDKHPDDEGAQEYYDALYGKLFDRCPNLQAVSIVGESTNFKSKDPKAGKSPYKNNFVDNIPTGKWSPGWWPCYDYPAWLKLIKNAIEKYNPDTELIFSTYNWGFAPEEDRIRLIESLPDGITVQVTWDMFHQYRLGNSVQDVVDYSLAFAGPGEYFTSEAKAIAKRKGLKLQANSQTSGRTWDFGVVPYEPMPGQWIKRYEGMIKAAEEWGLSSICDNIHYGFYPSIITDIEKRAFFTPAEPLDSVLDELLVRDYGENAAEVKKAFCLFDEAILHYPPTNEDQYGAFRIGPSYPFWLEDVRALPGSLPETGRMPDRGRVMFGNGIYFPTYTPDVAGRNSLTGVRIFDEIKSLGKFRDLMFGGLEVLKAVKNPNKALERLKLLAEFIYRTTLTVINLKNFYILQQKLHVAETSENAEALLDEIEKILLDEKANVEATIPLVREDSRLGWEPSMEYTTDEWGLNWKLRQLAHELSVVIPKFRKGNRLIRDF
ncbi:MAG: glycoside hydrolase family 20 zincin-like fold domain-containing protein [Monoglobales bacterium]